MTKGTKRILSGARPTGMLHLGNYWGAIRQIIDFQNQEFQPFYFVADLHALTTSTNQNLSQDSIELAAGYIACGLDPEKTVIYRQSSINKIPYLATLLSMFTSESWLRKCTTYKEKSASQAVTSLGLLSYPVLMAADIIIMDADIVPVGHDQIQHIEMTRDIALRFNNIYEPVFKLPKAYEMKMLRIPSLDGSGKMGKSDKNFIGLFEEPKAIKKKIMAALTDEGPQTEMSLPMQNIYSILKLHAPEEVYLKYLDMYKTKQARFYGELKKELAHWVLELVSPFREKYNGLNRSYIQDVLKAGADKANLIAEGVFSRVQEKMNL